MDSIKQWAVCIVLSSIVGAMVYILTPNGGTQKAMRVMVSMFIISAMLSPFLTGKGIYLELDALEYSQTNENIKILEDSVNEQIKKRGQEEMQALVQKILDDQQIKNGQISIEVDIDENNSIFIKTIEVTIPKEHSEKKSRISKEIKNQTNIEAQIYTE